MKWLPKLYFISESGTACFCSVSKFQAVGKILPASGTNSRHNEEAYQLAQESQNYRRYHPTKSNYGLNASRQGMRRCDTTRGEERRVA